MLNLLARFPISLNLLFRSNPPHPSLTLVLPTTDIDTQALTFTEDLHLDTTSPEDAHLILLHRKGRILSVQKECLIRDFERVLEDGRGREKKK